MITINPFRNYKLAIVSIARSDFSCKKAQEARIVIIKILAKYKGI
jgi:hypothetical protein